MTNETNTVLKSRDYVFKISIFKKLSIIPYSTVRENVCNNSKKRKKSCFFGF